MYTRGDGERRVRKNRDARLTRLSALDRSDSLGGENQSGDVPAGSATKTRLQMMINVLNLSAAKTTAAPQ